MKTALTAAVLVALAALPAAAQKSLPGDPKCDPHGILPTKLEGIAFAGDGDTINGSGWAWSVRLWGLNAPELRDQAKAETVPGMRARALVADLLAANGHKTSCEPIEFDSR